MCYFAHAVTSHVASAPRLAEDVAAFVPVSLPARARKALLASDQSQIERTPFFGVTMFAPSRFLSSNRHLGGCAGQWRMLEPVAACSDGPKSVSPTLISCPFAVWIGGGRD
jgi:hypothetical protein